MQFAAERTGTLKSVIFASYFASYLEPTSELNPIVAKEVGAASVGQVYEDSLVRALDGMRRLNLRVGLLHDVPTLPKSARACRSSRPFAFGDGPAWDCRFSRTFVDGEQRSSRTMLERVRTRAGNVPVFDPMPLFCGVQTCSALRDGRTLYFDTNHLNVVGARYLVPLLSDWIEAEVLDPSLW